VKDLDLCLAPVAVSVEPGDKKFCVEFTIVE